MGKITGFLEEERELPADRPVQERIKDWENVHTKFPESLLKKQAGRCMDCAIPFCHKGCPLGNIIPDWNDFGYRNRWKEALTSLLSTNNFPEFTGRICPAPCEDACVLNIYNNPVTIERIEQEIAEHGYREGWIKPPPPKVRTGKRVAVVGSGPSGLACADQLNKAGHQVTVFERSDRVGGLLMYGIPDFKLEKWVVQRRIELMAAEGVEFRTNAHVGVNVSVAEIRSGHDPLLIATPATHAKDKRVVILGGGDPGSDCHGTSLRQGCKSLHSFELLPKPPETRATHNPWPEWGRVFRTSSSHEEGGQREWGILTKRFSGENGRVQKMHVIRVEWKADQNGQSPRMIEIPGSEFELEVDLVLLALGFLGPEKNTLIKDLGVEMTDRGNVKNDKNYMNGI